jgi:hypothetical protein
MVVKVGTAKIWDGSEWQEAVPTWAKFSTTPTGNYTDDEGIEWDYWIYKANGTLVATSKGLADYLVVAGGASGATSNAVTNVGAGGAGGVIQSSEYAKLDAGTYAVTIGAGGATSGSTESSGNPGSNSSLGAALVAIGGGFGSYRGDDGGDGGCGGGAGDRYTGANSQRAGYGTFSQGYPGGSTSGGGGGAGGPGLPNNGVGGVGRTTDIISDTIATSESVGQVDSGLIYFGGGGGAGNNTAGGLGGGGAGSPGNQRGVDCLPNTGGGSGTSDINEGAPYSGVGGSGCVIVRTRA